MVELAVYGMRCEGCATSLRLGLGEVPGVTGVSVDLRGGTVRVAGHALVEATLRATVAQLGYCLTPPKPLLGRWRRRAPR